MRARLPLALALLALLAGLAGPAAAETLVVSLSTSRVSIDSNYTGAQVVVFGSIERDAQSGARAGSYDIVLTVKGPPQIFTLREKERVGPIWVNRDQRRYEGAPLFLAVLATREIDQITAPALRRRFRVGLESLIEAPDFAKGYNANDAVFRQALIRLQSQSRLYVENPRGVTFLTPSLFRAVIALPATAPPGNYEVEAALFASEVPLSRSQTNFELVKAGFEQQTAIVARERSVLYGLGVAFCALFFGWGATVIFRRD